MNQYLVDSPYTPFTIKNQFKAIYNGKVYIGEVDKDPLNPSQQIQVYVVDEAGSNVPVSQPIQLNAGGYLSYNGQVSKFITLEPYSMVVLNSVNAEMWRVDDISKVDPDNITASNVKKNDGGSVQDFIDAQYTTVAELATGKFQIGQYVRLIDKAMGLFLLQSGGTPNGFDILDASNSNTATLVTDVSKLSEISSIERTLQRSAEVILDDDAGISSMITIEGDKHVTLQMGKTLTAAKNIPAITLQNSGDGLFENIKVVGDAEATDTASSMFINTQVAGTISVKDQTFNHLRLSKLTLGLNLTKTVNNKVKDSIFDDMVYIPSLNSGGYGVLLQGSKDTEIFSSKFIATAESRHAVYTSRLVTDGVGVGNCVNTNIHDVDVNWIATNGTNDESKIPFAVRSPNGWKLHDFTVAGGAGLVIVKTENGAANDVEICNGTATGLESRNNQFCAAISIGQAGTGFAVSHGKIDTVRTVITRGAGQPAARDVGCLFNNVENFNIVNYTSTVDTGVMLSLTNCRNMIIDDVTDIVSGNNGPNVQPVIAFSGECSKITIGNVNHNRADIAGKKAIYGAVNNVTDLTCRFPRNARLSFNSGVLTIFDPWDLIASVTQNVANIVVNYKSHVTQDAADTAQYTNRSVTAVGIFKTSTAGKTGSVAVTDGSLVGKNMTTYSGTIEINLYC